MKPTIADRICSYLEKHPDSDTPTVAHDLDLTHNQAGRWLSTLEQSGVVVCTGTTEIGYKGTTKVWRLALSIDEKLSGAEDPEPVRIVQEEPKQTEPEGFHYRQGLTMLENDILRYVYTYPGSTVSQICGAMFGKFKRSAVAKALCRLDQFDLVITSTIDNRGTRAYYPPEAME